MQDNAIKSLTAGQTIKVPTAREMDLAQSRNQVSGKPPSNPSPFAVSTNPLFASPISAANVHLPPVGTQAQGSFVGGNGQVNLQQGYFGGGNQQQTNQAQGAYLGQGVYLGQNSNNPVNRPHRGDGQVNPQLTAAAPTASGGVNQYGNTQYSPSARPQGLFAENPDAWRAYWNYSAQHPETVPATPIRIPTRNDIWEMKAQQRRREAGKGGSEQTQNYNIVTDPITGLPSFGNNINTAFSWRV